MKQISKNALRWLPALIYFAFIWFLSSGEISVDIAKTDKFLHVAEYAIMGFLFAFGFNLNTHNFRKTGKFCFLFAALTGAVDEIHQYFILGRSACFYDFFADIIGCAIGLALWLVLINLLNWNE